MKIALAPRLIRVLKKLITLILRITIQVVMSYSQ